MIDLWRKMWSPHWIPKWAELSPWFRWRKWAIGVIFAGIVGLIGCGWLIGFILGAEPWAVIRDVAIGIVAIVGLRLAWIRSKAAADQAASALASNRTELLNSALRGLSGDEVPQKVAAVRILVDLARQDFDAYFATAVEALAAMVRGTAADKEKDIPRVRPEAQLAVQQIAYLIRRFAARAVFTDDQSILPHSVDFSNAYLPGLRISEGAVTGIVFRGATLDGARMRHIEFHNVSFVGASLKGAILIDQPRDYGPFAGVDFDHADVTGASFDWELNDEKDTAEQRDALQKTLTDEATWDATDPPITLGLPVSSKNLPVKA